MDDDAPNGFDDRVQQRATAQRPLETIPVTQEPRGYIPNTPLSASIISFLLGIIFCLGLLAFLFGGFDGYWWATQQLGFFIAAWSAFHWGEFAVTAGWNREKCSVDCMYN
jgi:protein-S-isoprenylcysteine O-methyltransferase